MREPVLRAIEEYAVAHGRRPDPAAVDAEWIVERHPELDDVVADHFPVLAIVAGEPVATVLPGRGAVRLLEPDDPDLGAVVGALGAGYVGSDTVRPQDPLDRPDRMRRGALLVAGAFVDGRAVGGGLASPTGATAELSGMAVVPAARGLGLGRALVAARVAALLERGVTTVFTTATTPAAVAVAEAAGLRRVGVLALPAPPPAAQVVELGPEDWPELREIRLRALADAPDAFGVTLADVVDLPPERWRSRLTPESPTYVVREHGRTVAMAGGFRVPGSATAMLWGMWTAPEARGRGHARRLLDEVVAWADRNGRTTLLHVTEGNVVARKVYVDYGFEPTGTWAPLREGSQLRIEELRLRRG